MMKNPFWNPEQRRLRALWRLAIQALLSGVAIAVLGAAAGLALRAWLVSRPGGTALLGDPAALQRAMLSYPLYRLVNMGITLAAIVGSVALAGRFLDRRRFADFGFHLDRAWWLDLAFGMALGALLMGSIFLVEWAAGWLTISGTLHAPGTQAFLPAILGALLGFVAVGLYEELLSRGYQLRNLAEGLNGRLLGERGAVVLAWLLSSSFFGILHAGNPNATPVSTANLVVAGLFLGLGYTLTGELAIPIGLHIGWNFCQGNVFGFPVSGTQAGATIIAVAQGGPELWTGGAFGPEAGLIGLAAILAGSVLIVFWVRARRGQATLWRPLAQAPSPLDGREPAAESHS